MENDHDHQQVEQHEQEAAGAFDDDDNDNEEMEEDVIAAVILKLNTILQRRKEFPLRQRNRIIELAEEYIEGLGNDIHDMLCDQNPDAETYHGLDCNRDTKKEVETALRLFPQVLSRRKDVVWDEEEEEEVEWIAADDGEGEYPVQCIFYMPVANNKCVSNLKAIPFIALLVRVAIDSNQFVEEERGGLLCEDNNGYNTLQHLSCTGSHPSYGEVHNQLVDNTCVTQMVQLRRMGILKKEDILDHHLVSDSCLKVYFPEMRFRFLVEWNPNSLLQIDDEYGLLPLHNIADGSTIEEFRIVFEHYIRYYPKKKGIRLLFMKSTTPGQTPFGFSCEVHGLDKVMNVIEEILSIYNNSQENTQLNFVEALITAAIDENIHLDCVYFLLRREPDVLVRLLSGFTSNNNNNNDDGDDDGNGSNRADDDVVIGGVVENGSDRDDINNNVGSDDELHADTNANVDENHRKRKRDS